MTPAPTVSPCAAEVCDRKRKRYLIRLAVHILALLDHPSRPISTILIEQYRPPIGKTVVGQSWRRLGFRIPGADEVYRTTCRADRLWRGCRVSPQAWQPDCVC